MGLNRISSSIFFCVSSACHFASLNLSFTICQMAHLPPHRMAEQIKPESRYSSSSQSTKCYANEICYYYYNSSGNSYKQWCSGAYSDQKPDLGLGLPQYQKPWQVKKARYGLLDAHFPSPNEHSQA